MMSQKLCLSKRKVTRTLIAIILSSCHLVILSSPALAQAVGQRPTQLPVISIAIMPGAPGTVLAGVLNAPNSPGVYRSTDGARSWQGAEGFLENMSIAGLAYDLNEPQTVLAGDGGFGHLFRSQNGGQIWEEVGGFKELLSANSAIGELYTTIENGGTVFYAPTRFSGLFRSEDQGNSWQPRQQGLVGDALRVREVVWFNGSLYAGTHGGLYQLSQGAGIWNFVNTLPSVGIVFSVTTFEGALYLGTQNGIWWTQDAVTWQQVPGIPSANVYDMSPSSTRLIAATEAGIWQGVGSSWQIAQVDGVPYNGVAYSVATIPNAPSTVYVGTAADWVLRSDNGGANFATILTMFPFNLQAALATLTPTPTDTPLPTATPPPTATPLPTNTPTMIPLPTDTIVPTDTPVVDVVDSDPATSSLTSTITFVWPPLPGSDQRDGITDTVTDVVSGTTELESGDREELPLFPSATPTDVKPPTATAQPSPTELSATATETPTPEETATPVPTSTSTVTPTPSVTPTETALPTATATPVDIAMELYNRMPPFLMGAGIILLGLIIVAGWSIINGPRDI